MPHPASSNPSETFEVLLKTGLERHLNERNCPTPAHLAESIRYSLLAPGKRIRPRLLLAGAKLMGLSPEAATPAAIALEMIHCFTLIHDDLPCMDNDDFRRGMPSNHKKFNESTALLAGDALMALAIDVFLDSPVESPLLLSGLRRLIQAVGPRGVIGGQAAESQLGPQSNLKDLQRMHAQKTGALFSAALLIPKDFAKISDESPHGRIIHQFATTLGLAFQAADDLEDLSNLPNGNPAAPIQPTSILYYLSENEVRTQVIQELQASCEPCHQHWGEKAEILTGFAKEIIEKIKLTQASSKAYR